MYIRVGVWRVQGTKCIVEEQRTLDMKWLAVRRPTAACQQLIRRTFTWDFVERPTARTVLFDRWMLDYFTQSPQPPAQPYPDPATPVPAIHLHTVGDWAVAATGK